MLSSGKDALILKIYLPLVLKTSVTVKHVIVQYNIVRLAAVLGGWMASKQMFQEWLFIPHQENE